jgi:hypothetical protein
MTGNGTLHDDDLYGISEAAPELAALAAARAVPPPDAAVVAAALSAVRAAAGREAREVAAAAEVAEIREAGEVREAGEAGSVAGVGSNEAAALAGVTRTGEVPAPAQPPAPARTRGARAARALRTGGRRRWIVAAACVAALTAGLAALPTVGADGPPPAAANAASAFLGSVAAHARGSSVGANASLLTTVRERRPGSPETEFTVAIGHGQGVIRPARGHGPAQSPNVPYGPFLAPSFSWREVATLPSGTAQLRARLEELAPHQDLFRVIGGLLSISPVTPQVRAALYRVLATVPGVDLLGPGRDARGRAGTWVAHDDGTTRWKLLLDPDTGRLLQQDQVTLKAVPAAPCTKDRTPPACPPALAAGDLVSRMTFLSQRVTD